MSFEGGNAVAPVTTLLGALGALSAKIGSGTEKQAKCCEILRTWGKARKVTKNGVITEETVEVAIARWLATSTPLAVATVTATTVAAPLATGVPAKTAVAAVSGNTVAVAAVAPPATPASPAISGHAPQAIGGTSTAAVVAPPAAATVPATEVPTARTGSQLPAAATAAGPSSVAVQAAVPPVAAPALPSVAAPTAAPTTCSTSAPTKGTQERGGKRGGAHNGPLTKRQRTKELQEQQRLEEEARQAAEERDLKERAAPFVGLSIEEMREKRMAEVLQDMTSRLQSIVVRIAEALGQQAPDEDTLASLCGGATRTTGGSDGMRPEEQREAYLRAIHREREDVPLPEGLEAELMPHQVDGLEWMVSVYINGLHGILADEMGLGKTLQTIAWLQWLKESKGNKGPHLVVAPKSTLSNWQTEFKRFAPTYKSWLVVGDQEERAALAKKLGKRIKDNKTTCFITNYEQIHRNDWLQDFDWQCIIIDEGHRMKNQKSVLHETMTKMKCKTKMLLTGTPLQNNMSELWALLHYLLPELFTSTLDFQSWFLDPLRGVEGLNEYEVSLRPEDEQLLISRLHLMLSPFLLQRTKLQVMEDKLPPKTEYVVRVPLSAWQQSAYQDLQKRTIRLMSSDDKVQTAKVNNALMQLRKITLHPYLFSGGHRDPGIDILRSSGKLEALDRMLEKLARFRHKTLIFSQFTTLLDVVAAYLRWRGRKFARLDGQTPHEERRRQMVEFADPAGGIDVFILSARAGGLGLNLQAADTVVLFDLDWNPQNDKQAIARSHRFGQQREVRVFRLLTDSAVERHMERRCQEKLNLEQKIIGAGMFSKAGSQEQRADMLKTILGLAGAGPADSTDGLQPGDTPSTTSPSNLTSPEELNRLLARGEEELCEFERMDSEALQPLEGSDPTLPFLVRCGRLMRTEEVPKGFQVEDSTDDDA